MENMLPYLILAAASLAGLAIIALAGLRGWQGWLDLKRSELPDKRLGPTGDRIEIADLKQRIRRLEAIAA